jgi:hypothetical protein
MGGGGISSVIDWRILRIIFNCIKLYEISYTHCTCIFITTKTKSAETHRGLMLEVPHRFWLNWGKPPISGKFFIRYTYRRMSDGGEGGEGGGGG